MSRTRIASILLAAAVAGGCAPLGAAAGAAGGGGATLPLEGTTWHLTELGGDAALPSGGAAPTLRLDPAGRRAGGNTGCNSFGGSYELSGASLRFGALISTKRACVDEALNAQEAAYLTALGNTRSWDVDGATLTLSGPAGRLARFSAR